MIENMISILLLDKNKVLVSKDFVRKSRFRGAFVFPAIPGVYKSLVAFDYASLYPTMIRQHNISPEIFLSKISSIPKKLDKEVSYCASGATFKKNQIGVLPILETELYSNRKAAKKKYGEIQAEIEELKKILKRK